MKRNNFLHGAAVISCSFIFYRDDVIENWIWCTVLVIWIASSYFNSYVSYTRKKEIEEIQKEKRKMIDDLAKADTRAWKAEMKLKNNK